MTVDSTPPASPAPTSTPEPGGITQYTDGYAYEVPRPFLTLQQAAAILGKSLRTLERSVSGRWGNKLPEGWLARKLRTEHGDEWRILPPPGFRVKMSAPSSATERATEYDTEPYNNENFDIGSTNLPEPPARRRQQWRPERHTLDHPAIVIDRTEEVESLLRDLVAAQRALAEERRLHLEDLRVISQLQSSMRLLETNSIEQSKLKTELEAAKLELNDLRDKYNEQLNLPWWRRLFTIKKGL